MFISLTVFNFAVSINLPLDYDPENEETKRLLNDQISKNENKWRINHFLNRYLRWPIHMLSNDRIAESCRMIDKDESYNWWSKYYASLEV